MCEHGLEDRVFLGSAIRLWGGVKDGDVVLVVAKPEGRQSIYGKGTSGRTQ